MANGVNILLNTKKGVSLKGNEKVFLLASGKNNDTTDEIFVYLSKEDDSSKHIGLVNSNPKLQVEGTISKEDLYSKMKEVRNKKFITATLKESVKVGMSDIPKFIASVDLDQFKPKVPVGNADKHWEWKVNGSAIKHEDKLTVVTEFNDSGKSEVQLSLDNDEVILTRPNMKVNSNGDIITAGKLANIEEEQLAELTSLLKVMKTLDGNVIETNRSTYTIRVSVEKEVVDSAKSGKPIETVQSVKDEIFQNVGTEVAVLDEIEAYLLAQNFDKATIKLLFKMHKSYPAEMTKMIPKKPKTPYMDKEGLFADSVEYILGGDSQLLEGDASVGKNVLVQTMAWVLQKPHYVISMNAQTDKFDLVGSPTANMEVDEHGNGVSVVGFSPSGLVQMMECGGMVLLDELNASNPSVMTLLHNIAEKGQKTIDVEGYGHVAAEEGFILYGAMNPGFEGTSELNEAFDSRFPTLDFGRNTSIIDLLHIHDESKNASEATLRSLEKVYQKLYKLVAERNEIDSKVLAFRRFASAAYYAERPRMGLRKALIQNVANKASDPMQKEKIKDVIDACIE